MSASDAIQRVSEAVQAIIDADAGVQAITGRSSENIVRFNLRRVPRRPGLAYLCTQAENAGGVGENWHVSLVLRAEAIGDAATEISAPAQANALVRAGFAALTPQAFDGQSCDAIVYGEPDFSNLPDDGADPSTNPVSVRAEAEGLIWITL